MPTKTLAEPAADDTVTKNGRGVAAPPTAPDQAHSDGRDQGEVEGSKRRMPDNLRRYLIRMQGGKMYLPAAYRIVWFRDELGDDWGVRTNLIEGGHEAGFATVHAEVLNPEGRVIASGMKTESKQDFAAGWVEKAESGAVARALALLGFGTQFTPELDEDGYRPADSPQPAGRYVPPRSTPEPVRASASTPRTSAAAPRSERDAMPAQQSANGHTAAEQSAALPSEPFAEIWAGPGQCPKCHAPEGKRHGKVCLTGSA